MQDSLQLLNVERNSGRILGAGSVPVELGHPWKLAGGENFG